ncbi:MAG: aminotransferase class I/II-fold pyridoxal phosphate-dependent enzyme [Oscillospiraceae bacterium]|nr:aminotransferase class I/II-fold pyridoxal phosphate-dependent enzyme [Oscillospiraceae bacterium]
MRFAKRMEQFEEGVFSELLAMKKGKEEAGTTVIDLSVGTPNIPPAECIRRTLADAARDPRQYVYAISDTPELQQAVVQWYARRYGVTLNPETQVASLLGSQEGLTHIALSIVDSGDTVLVPDPCYPAFSCGPMIAGARLCRMPLKKENDYLIDFDAIPEKDAKAAKMMVVSYPNNPTASVAPDWFYEKLIAFAKKYDIIVVHDNAYSELVFDGKSCGSFLKFPGAMDVGVEFNSLSKTYGMAGARVGFCLGNAEIVGMLKKLKSNMDYGMFLPIQNAAAEAITGEQSCVARTCAAYEKRRNLLCELFDKLGWHFEKPAATMFVWAAVPASYGTDDRRFARDLLNQAGVLVTPGSAFGPAGCGHVRMALVQDEKALQEAAERMSKTEIFN